MDDKALFPFERWEPNLPDLSAKFQSAKPFPYIYMENFMEEATSSQALKEFPRPGDATWIHYKHFNENKLGKTKRDEFPDMIGKVVDEFNSPRFVEFISKLSGIPGLIPDPSLEGGGMHQTESGGFLNVHADFTMHHHHPTWRRRLNLILCLNEGWKSEWGGALELWSRDMKGCAAKVEPLFNNAAMFATDDTSFHGYPDAITCPKDVTRKSLALYYYTIETDSKYVAKSTNYQARPGETWKVPFVWLDKKDLHLYSLVKKRLGLSDDFASKVLQKLSGKKKK